MREAWVRRNPSLLVFCFAATALDGFYTGLPAKRLLKGIFHHTLPSVITVAARSILEI